MYIILSKYIFYEKKAPLYLFDFIF